MAGVAARRRSNSASASTGTTQRGLPHSAVAVLMARSSPRLIQPRTLSGLTRYRRVTSRTVKPAAGRLASTGSAASRRRGRVWLADIRHLLFGTAGHHCPRSWRGVEGLVKRLQGGDYSSTSVAVSAWFGSG